MAAGVSREDEEYRSYALNAPPMRVLLTVCAPLALYQALQSIFKILDALMASHISSNAVSAVSCLSQITLMITAIGAALPLEGASRSLRLTEKGNMSWCAAVLPLSMPWRCW